MKVLDLFSGIGGFSLGLERAGFETVAFCEIDSTAQKVLKKHWPKVPIFDDVENLSGFDFEENEIDVICGGFPCQDISVAGNKKGLAGKRSGLWFEYRRLINEIKPKYVIIENVANLRSLGLTRVLKDLWALGYDAEWHIIPARAVGAHHLRERIWVIAKPSNGDDFRLFPPLTSEKEESLRWSKTAARVGGLWGEQRARTRTQVRRIPHGLSRKLDRPNIERIKQLGNAVVPQIPQLIGEAILNYENSFNN